MRKYSFGYKPVSAQGFTLIELLVVISIIGLLSSVILVSLNTARDKGRVSSGVTFATHMFRAYSEDSEAHWGFDEGGTASITYDFFKKHPGTLDSNLMWNAVRDTPSGSGYSLAFNGARRVAIPSSFQVKGKFTIAAWVRIPTIGSDMTIFSNGPTGLTKFWITSTGLVRGTYGIFSLPSVGRLTAGKWHHVAWTNNGLPSGNTSVIYIDGKKDTTGPVPASDTTGSSASIGCHIPLATCTEYFNGSIDEVAVYTQAFAATDIQRLYAQGLSDHSDVLASASK